MKRINLDLLVVLVALALWPLAAGPATAATERVPRADGDIDIIETEPGSPFTIFRRELRNPGTTDREVRTIEFSREIPLKGKPGDYRTMGVDGLKPADAAVSSYLFLAIARPDASEGTVAGWLTQERGSGSVHAKRGAQGVTLTGRLEFGRLRITPGATVVTDGWAVGSFADARAGLETYGDTIARLHNIKLPRIPNGYCTWYSSPHGGASDEKALAELAVFCERELAPYGFDTILIDDQWQGPSVTKGGIMGSGPTGNFTRHDPKGPYPSGMANTAQNLVKHGLRPGLWYTPFSWDPRDPLFADHQDWFVRKENGSFYEVLWAGWCLDMTHPDARSFLSDAVRRITGDWGFRYLKPDAMWCGLAAKCNYPGTAYVDENFGDAVFHDPYMTGIEAYRTGIRTMRAAAGPNTYIAACNVAQNFRSMGGAMGLVDAMRIGPDTGADWNAILPNFHLGTRLYFLHNRVWHNDPDCLMVRAPLTLTQARSFASWVAVSGTLNLVSEWLPGLPADRLDCVKRSMPNTGLAARPLDLFTQMPAQAWHVTDGRRHVAGLFNWSDSKPITVRVPLTDLGFAPDAAAEFVALDYWSGALQPVRQGQLATELAPSGCSVLAVAQIVDHPQLLGTSRHITHCFVDVTDEQWGNGTLSGGCKVVGGDATELRIAAVSTGGVWKARTVEVSEPDREAGVTASFKTDGDLVRVSLKSPKNREVKWKVRFEDQPGPRTAAMQPAAGEEFLDLRRAVKATNGWGAAQNNASVEGKPLRIGSAEFEQGIGTHAPAEIIFRPENGWRWLSFYAGVNADMTERGSVTVQVWADGKKAYESDVLRVHEEPVYVTVPIAGVQELRIVGTDAGDGIAADHLNLCQIRVSSGAAAPKPSLPPMPVLVGEAAGPESSLTLWYRQPAKRWLESLPVGNGRLGAMLFGGIHTERVALNESTFWSGAPDSSHDPPAREHLAEMRRLLFQQEYRKAVDLIARHLLGRQGNYGTHLPVGDLLLNLQQPPTEIRDYRRDLDIDQSLASVSYAAGGVRFTRQLIASHPDKVLALRLTADQPGQISFQLGFRADRQPAEVRTEDNDTLVLTAQARESKHSNGKTGVSLAGRVRVIPEGGTLSAQGEHLQVDGANAVTILVALNTTFSQTDPATVCRQQIADAAQRPFPTLLRRHVEDCQPLFRRVSLDLGASPAPQLPTDQRLARVREGKEDPALVAQFFQYGRYLLIAGSRADSPLPTNLQGIWNDNLACNMGWTCDFHLDINTQQNYWPAEVCNLSESHEPLFRLIESLREPGRQTARKVYGAEGWVCHVFTNPWGYTAPGWGLGWGVHPTGGIWIASHLWEHYRFTGDRDFLRSTAYPTLKEAAQFFLSYMVEHPKYGWLVTGPATSPENAFMTPNGEGAVSESMGPTCDTVLVRDLFASCIEASRILDVDPEVRDRLTTAGAKLAPLRAGKNGQLMEWLEDYDEAAPNHRHTTHLIALYPSEQITPRGTPELARAARVTIDRRLSCPDWEDVEWSRGNLIVFFARLHEAALAHHHLLGLLREDTDRNLLTFSRGGIAGAPENIFCVDGNSAGTAGIAEMLLQSHARTDQSLPSRYELAFLEALPEAWPTGAVNGLRARGGFQVDLAWNSGKLTRAVLRSRLGGSCTVRYRDTVKEVTVQPGEALELNAQLIAVR